MALCMECDPLPDLKHDLFIRAAFGQNVERVPIWVMRQAGRYLPEFRELRKRYEFFELCQNPELACEVTMQPMKRFNLDAAIIFSDILVVPQALGMEVEIKPQLGINIPDHLKTPEDIFRLKWPTDEERLLGLVHVHAAVRCTRFKLKGRAPLIGFAGGPWTLMAYMVQGSGSMTMSSAKRFLYQWPEYSRKLLGMLSNVIVNYLIDQIHAGAQAVQVFESNVGHLGPELFKMFVLPYLKQISQTLREKLEIRNIPLVPIMIYAKGAHYALNDFGSMGYDVVSLDWTISPTLARECIGENVTLQGNLDPCALYGDAESIKQQAVKMLNEFGPKRYIANLGHGIYPDTNPDNLRVLIDTVQLESRKMIDDLQEVGERYD